MKQLIAFNQAIAGTVHNFCLDNVRRGFGIENKYASAWEAWNHTQQHTDPIPEGVDVPLFYSYTANIDGVTENYGHINVRLADGTVWSDGNIYPSLDAYLAYHTPVYVGWGESVNDFKIIEEGEQLMNHNAGTEAYVTVFHRDAENSEVADQWNAYSPEFALKSMRDTDEWKAIDAKVKNYDKDVAAAYEKGLAEGKAAPEPTPAPVEPPTPVFPEIHVEQKSLLRVVSDFLSKIFIGVKK